MRTESRAGFLAILGLMGLPLVAPAQSAVLTGRVLADSVGTPVPFALVELPVLGMAARTDSSGRFRLTGIPGGEHVLTVRAIGHDLLTSRLPFGVHDTLEIEMEMGSTMTRLATVRTSASVSAALAWRLREFEQRRAEGFGRFITRDVFEANEGRSIALLVAARIPGVRVVGRGSDETIQVVRLGRPCRPQLIVNGMEQEVTLGAFQATDILGLEFHTTSTVPMQHRGTGKRESGAWCGTVILWTK